MENNHLTPQFNKEDDFLTINIGRQLGSGGRAIARILAERLHLPLYDKELLDMAAQESGFDKRFFENNDEEKGFFSFMNHLRSNFQADSVYQNQLSDEALFKFQSDAIIKAAHETSCIFVGRCADYVLRNKKHCINIFISADTDDRLQRVCQFEGLTRKEGRKRLEEGDKRRSSYYNYYTDRPWGHASTYHLCINSSLLGMEKTAELILHYIEETQKEWKMNNR